MENENGLDELMTRRECRKKFEEIHKTLVNDQIQDYVYLKDVNKVYPGNVHAVYDFTLGIDRNEFVVLVGPSGCGKSTTLRMIAGLEEISSGYFYVDKVLSNDRTPKERDVAMVFQNYALYPHMNVYDNISFGLKLRKERFPILDEEGRQKVGVDKGRIGSLRWEQLRNAACFWKKGRKERAERIRKELEQVRKEEVPLFVVRHYNKKEIDQAVFKAASILDLGSLLDRKPKQLSGGQMQRVALGRAIVRRPKLFLMDEPLSNLDAKLRVQMRSEIVRIHKEVNATTIYVTHDQTEAMTMADKVVVMNKGFIQQVGTPLEIYRRPYNIFVATFIGSPSMNILEGEYDGGTIVLKDRTAISLPESFRLGHDSFYREKISYWEDIFSRFDHRKEEEATEEIRNVLSLLKDGREKEEILPLMSKLLAFDGIPLERRKLLERPKREIEMGLKDEEFNPSSLTSHLKECLKILQEDDLVVSQSLAMLKSHAVFEIDRKDGREKKDEKKSKVSKEEILSKEKDEISFILSEYQRDLRERHPLKLGIRPEDIQLAEEGEENAYQGQVRMVELLGSEYLLHVELFGTEVLAKVKNDAEIRPGDRVHLKFSFEKLHLFDSVSSLAIDERRP